MQFQTESKFQCWRAIAVCEQRELLLHLGRSSDQVRGGYASAFADLLDADEQAAVLQIVLQCWAGVADQGHWSTKSVLPVPKVLSPGRGISGSMRRCGPEQIDADLSDMSRRIAGVNRLSGQLQMPLPN